MLTEYIQKQLNQARYKMLEDDSYFGEIEGLNGVWASEKKLENCREILREVLEEWLILKLHIPNKHNGDISAGLVSEILRQVAIDKTEWNKL